jgi:hypothetical protein
VVVLYERHVAKIEALNQLADHRAEAVGPPVPVSS